MATINAKDLRIGMQVKNHHGSWVTAKDVFKSPINGRVYVTYSALHEAGVHMEDEDIMYPFYLSQVEVRVQA